MNRDEFTAENVRKLAPPPDYTHYENKIMRAVIGAAKKPDTHSVYVRRDVRAEPVGTSKHLAAWLTRAGFTFESSHDYEGSYWWISW